MTRMPLSLLAQIKENELKSMCDCKQDEGEPEGFHTGEKHSSVKKIKKKQPTAGIQGPFKKPPPTFFHYLGLQDDSQSLCTVAVQKKRKKLVTDFFPLFFALRRASSFFSSLFVLPSPNSIHVIKHPCRAAGIAGNYFCFVFCFFANNIQ